MQKYFLPMMIASLAARNLALADITPPIEEELNKMQNGACRVQYDNILDREFSNRTAVFFERFFFPLQKVEKPFTSSNDVDQVVEGLTKVDVRRDVFPYETGLYIYQDFFKKVGYKDEFAQLLEDSKTIEDQIGQVVDGKKAIQNLFDLGLPEKALDKARERFANASELLKETLSQGWIGKDASSFKRIVKIFDKIRKKVPTQKEDQQYLQKWFQGQADWLENEPIDVNNLQGGLHEFRRHARRVLIAYLFLLSKVNFVPGKATLDDFFDQLLIPKDKKTKAYIGKNRERLLKYAEESKKYLMLDKTKLDLKHQLYVDQDVFYTWGFFVTWIGILKDNGELYHNALTALLDSGTFKTKAAADRWLLPKLRATGWTAYEEEAKVVMDIVRQSGIFKNLFIDKPEND